MNKKKSNEEDHQFYVMKNYGENFAIDCCVK
jgi:hypothetical protein